MKISDIMSDEDLKRLLSLSAEEINEVVESKPTKKPEQKVKGTYKNNNLVKVLSFVNKVYPNDVSELYEEFGYKDYIVGLFTLTEAEYKKIFPKAYDKIQKCYDDTRADFRTKFEAARDICANFIIEDLFAKAFNERYKTIRIKLNEDEKRDIERVATNLPDFIFENLETGKTLRFDLKTDWSGFSYTKDPTKRKYFLRGKEHKDYYDKYKAVALIWLPSKNKFTFVCFDENFKGEEGVDESKGGKKGFWVDLSTNVFEEIFFDFKNKHVFVDNVVKKLDKFSRKN